MFSHVVLAASEIAKVNKFNFVSLHLGMCLKLPPFRKQKTFKWDLCCKLRGYSVGVCLRVYPLHLTQVVKLRRSIASIPPQQVVKLLRSVSSIPPPQQVVKLHRSIVLTRWFVYFACLQVGAGL